MLSLKASQCNDVVWPMWQILRVSRRSMIILPFGITNKRVTLGKTFCPFQLWDRVQPTHLHMNKRSRGFDLGSYKGPRKAKSVAIENYLLGSKNRFLWTLNAKIIHLIRIYSTPSIGYGSDTKMPSQSAGGDRYTKQIIIIQ